MNRGHCLYLFIILLPYAFCISLYYSRTSFKTQQNGFLCVFACICMHLCILVCEIKVGTCLTVCVKLTEQPQVLVQVFYFLEIRVSLLLFTAAHGS